ncbi:MAG: STAS domain-containing protein [Geobacteraceae bacterium]|nr:STAS domain-containing protein [Geobacteraceae bacterium]
MSDYTIARNSNADGSITLVLGGALTIETSGELLKALAESLDGSQQVMLNLRAVESIDMTSMQVICSGCKTAAKMGRGYECEPDAMPGCMLSFGSSIGGPQGLPCGQNDNKPCIWYGGIR